ncbi:hypothetical protein EZS27_025288 [termite gut metagenome]|uniref:Uncharacterized protein n=1 Tax=termite gut metagenome TaxID=433724 RepID=A0A5J4QUC2_9ZZZZ
MGKGYIKIINEEGKTPSVEAELVSNNLWISKYEIAKLFNCFPQKVEANLRSIFKSHLLWESDVTYTHKYTYTLDLQVYPIREKVTFVRKNDNQKERKTP